MELARFALAWLTDHAVIVMLTTIPTFVIGERVAAKVANRRLDDGAGTSIAAGLSYLAAKGIVSKLVMFAVAMRVYDQHRLFELDPLDPRVWLGVFVARDFVYYWIHRAEHRIAALWASHMIHHSSERFGFTTAVRMPWMEAVYKPLLGLWVPLLGFHPVAFAAMGALVLAAGQLQHTELLRRTPRLDRLFVTPSVHRVHHGSNPEYIDTNFGSMLSIWDRMFGTFEPEQAPVRYGLVGDHRVTRPAQALVGGYPQLWRRTVDAATTRARVGVLLSAPG